MQFFFLLKMLLKKIICVLPIVKVYRPNRTLCLLIAAATPE